MQTDHDLIQGCSRGRQRSWRDLIAKYGRLVYSVARRYGLSATDADDVFQAVFASLHRGLTQLRNADRLSAWLVTAAHRESLRAKRRRHASSDLEDSPDCETDLPEQQMAVWERQNAVHVGLRELGGRCEELLRMLFLEHPTPTYETIAAKLGVRIGSIGPTRARCFEALERILSRTGLFDDADD